MYFAQIALAVASFFVLLKGESVEIVSDDVSLGENDEGNKRLIENPTFVAIVDVVFTDGKKKTCTGSIIHEIVVITAAHCFKANTKKVWPELTASFVVIGNKLMFDTGYEQYIPIERVIIHPKFKDWTADLALVYTFASMTNDKPGTIIPIAGEKTTIHVDFNLTVLTWGHTAPDELSDHDNSCSSDDDGEEGCIDALRNRPEKQEKEEEEMEPVTETTTKPPTEPPTVKTTFPVFKELRQLYRDAGYQKHTSHKSHKEEHKKRSHRQRSSHKIGRSKEEKRSKKHTEARSEQFTKIVSRYLESGEQERGVHDNIEEIEDETEENSKAKPQTVMPRLFSFKSSFNNWRRSQGEAQHNTLYTESFSFINLQQCKYLVEKNTEDEHDITKTNDAVCYSSSGLYISDADSGAPAIRKGKLVAVTVGGVKYDSDRAAIGMKMSCYCSWIADNLPEGGVKFSCCKNCCDVKHKETAKPRGYKFRNKYLL